MDLLVTSYTHALLKDCETSRKACGLSELRSLWGSTASMASEARRLMLRGNLSTTMHVQSCTWIISRDIQLKRLSFIMSLPTNQIGRYLNYIQKPKWLAGGVTTSWHVESRRLSGSLYGFLGDVIHFRYCMTASYLTLAALRAVP